MPADLHRTIDAVWRMESPKLIASLTRLVRDVGLAEDLAQDALVAALEKWAVAGVPRSPGAWLMATAKNCALDQLRRAKRLGVKHEELGQEIEAQQAAAPAGFDEALDADDVGDDLLRLVFIACHPKYWRARRGWRSRCACSGASPPTRSRGRFWWRSPPSRSASCAPGAP